LLHNDSGTNEADAGDNVSDDLRSTRIAIEVHANIYKCSGT
jgi:hypothetical protein